MESLITAPNLEGILIVGVIAILAYALTKFFGFVRKEDLSKMETAFYNKIKDLDKIYQAKEMCSIKHDYVSITLSEVKSALEKQARETKEQAKETREGLSKLYEKFDELMKMFAESK